MRNPPIIVFEFRWADARRFITSKTFGVLPPFFQASLSVFFFSSTVGLVFVSYLCDETNVYTRSFLFFSSFRYLLYPFSFSACDITLGINNYCSIRLFDEQILALKNFATAKGCEKIIIDGKINAIVQKLKRNDDKNDIILAFVHVCLCECLMTTSGVCMSCICVQFYSDCIKSLQQQILLKKVSPL